MEPEIWTTRPRKTFGSFRFVIKINSVSTNVMVIDVSLITRKFEIYSVSKIKVKSLYFFFREGWRFVSAEGVKRFRAVKLYIASNFNVYMNERVKNLFQFLYTFSLAFREIADSDVWTHRSSSIKHSVTYLIFLVISGIFFRWSVFSNSQLFCGES